MSAADLTEADRHLMRERVFSWMSLDGGLLRNLIPPAQRSALDEPLRRAWVQEVVAQALAGNDEAQMRVLTREAAAALRRQAQECSAVVLKDFDSAHVLADTIGLMIAELKTVWDLLEASSHPDSSLRCSYEAAHLELLTVFVICIVYASFAKGAAAPDFDAVVAHEVFHSIIDVNFTEGNLEALSARLSALMKERGRLMSDLFGKSVSGISDSDRPLPASLLKGLTDMFSMASAGKYAMSFLDKAAFDGCWLVNMLELERSYASGVLVRRSDANVEAIRGNAGDAGQDEDELNSPKSLASPGKGTQQENSNDDLMGATPVKKRRAGKGSAKENEKSSGKKVRSKNSRDRGSDDDNDGNIEASQPAVVRTTRTLTQKSVRGENNFDGEQGDARGLDSVAEERVAKLIRVADRNKSRAGRDNLVLRRTKKKNPILARLNPLTKPPSVAKVAGGSSAAKRKSRKAQTRADEAPSPESRSRADAIHQDSRVARQGRSSASRKHSHGRIAFELSPRPDPPRRSTRAPPKPVRDTQEILALYGDEEGSDSEVKNAASEDDNLPALGDEDDSAEEEEGVEGDDVPLVSPRRRSSRGQTGEPSRAHNAERSTKRDRVPGRNNTDSDPRPHKRARRTSSRQRPPFAFFDIASDSDSDDASRPKTRSQRRSSPERRSVTPPRRHRPRPPRHSAGNAVSPSRLRTSPRLHARSAPPQRSVMRSLRVEIDDDDSGGDGGGAGGAGVSADSDDGAPAQRQARRQAPAARSRPRRPAGAGGALGFSARDDVGLVQLIAKHGYGEWGAILRAGRRAGLFRGRRAREVGTRARELARELDIPAG